MLVVMCGLPGSVRPYSPLGMVDTVVARKRAVPIHELVPRRCVGHDVRLMADVGSDNRHQVSDAPAVHRVAAHGAVALHEAQHHV